jgi:putative membrane protein
MLRILRLCRSGSMRTILITVLFTGAFASAGDSEVLAILIGSNNASIQQAILAKKKSVNPRIGNYADVEILDHRKANDRLIEIRKSEKLKPKVSDQSREIDADSKLTVKKLQKLKGREKDAAYIDAQIEAHRRMMTALDTLLIPDTKNPILRKNLEDYLLTMETHLNHATTIKETLQ